ncbi:MAG: hypothetical protein ACJ70P_04835 [Nitrososphaera sp.]
MNTRCNGGYENDMMEGMMIMASFTGLTMYRIMATWMAGKAMAFSRVNQTQKSTLSAAEQLKR